ncbi:C2 domain-containing protein 5-like [Haliotis cracherodii]|uniref:C2 domain-containing protein 5-like n=1 Tax=Haliotis cracherodii TaxID=6455 RepID=UPI0039E89FE3
MPGKLKVRILGARNLPVMDRASDLTDAFVEVRFSNEVMKTDVYRKSLNPQWDSDWYKFEVDDEVLQDEPLELRVLDYDTYSAHDAIGKVYIDLNPLLTRESPHVINGWFPVYDTMHGIRGELNVLVKVELFSDFNKFRQSSCGIQFFCTSEVPAGHRLLVIHGFVEELVVNNDPEYQWIDKLRTPRASNEARQRLFSKLSGELQRKIGVKVMEMGGNAVLGYCHCFDLEGESGIVVRGIGTAVTITKFTGQLSPIGVSPYKDGRHVTFLSVRHHKRPVSMTTSPPVSPHKQAKCWSPPPTAPPALHGGHVFTFPSSSPLPEDTIAPSSSPTPHRNSTSPVRVAVPVINPVINRRSSDSDLSSPPREVEFRTSKERRFLKRSNSLTGSSGSGSGAGSGTRLTHSRTCVQQQNIDMLEFPFFTMRSLPVGFIVHLGGVVSARSVKLLDKIHNPEEPETRDTWWTEIRTEIRSHARAMGCHAVIGYVEQTSICDEIIILSASGTAARVNLSAEPQVSIARSNTPLTSSLERCQGDKDKKLFVDINLANQLAQNRLSPCVDGGEDALSTHNCGVCHVPYKSTTLPFSVTLSPCVLCRRKKVPDILFTTIDPPPEILTWGKGSLVQARICRVRTKTKGETSAKEVSDCLPFMEYELHSQLMNKLKMKGMNGLFGLKIQVCVGDTMIVAVGSATATYLGPLPPPPIPKVSSQVRGATHSQTSMKGENATFVELQKKIMDTMQGNRERFCLDIMDNQGQPSPRSMATDESEDDQSDLELSIGNKETFVLEIDDVKDEMIAAMLHDIPPPDGIETCNTLLPPSVTRDNINTNLQMFTQVWRGRLAPQSKADFANMFESLLRKIYFKLRKLVPLCLAGLDFNVEIPDEDEIQISVTGCCLGVSDIRQTASTGHLSLPQSATKTPQKSASGTGEGEDMMFPMDITETSTPAGGKVIKPPKVEAIKKEFQYKATPPMRHPNGVELSPLPIVAGGKIEKYLGNYNFFFIRESTSVREDGGLGGFVQTAVAEVMAIVRAHVASLGGNALVAYRMTHCVLYSNPHKNQSQCLISVCGDAVSANYITDNSVTIIPDHIQQRDQPKVVNST